MTLDHVVDVLRAQLGVAPGIIVSPGAVVSGVGLELVPLAGVRSCVRGDELRLDDTLPAEMQLYLMARLACDHWLRTSGMIREHKAHDVAVQLCGVRLKRRRVVSMIKVRPIKRGSALGA